MIAVKTLFGALLGAVIGLIVGFFIAFIVAFVFAIGQAALGLDPTGHSAGNAAFGWTWFACIALGAIAFGLDSWSAADRERDAKPKRDAIPSVLPALPKSAKDVDNENRKRTAIAPKQKIECLKAEASAKDFHFKALCIVRAFGENNVFERDQLRIVISESDDQCKRSTSISICFGLTEVYTDQFDFVTHGYNRYGARYRLDSDDIRIDHPIYGYIPGYWEVTFFAIHVEAEQFEQKREAARKNERLNADKKRFGIE